MVKSKLIPAKINKELDEVRREFAKKNNIKMTEADLEIVKVIKSMRGKVASIKEIKF